jgi:excisionase family DNA binding protein
MSLDYPNSIPEAMLKLNAGRSYVYLLMQSGKLQFVKQGRRTYIFDTAIAAYLDALKVSA